MKTIYALALSLFTFAAAAQAGTYLAPADAAEVPDGNTAIPLVRLLNDRDNRENMLNLLVDQNRQVTGMYNQSMLLDMDPFEAFGKSVFLLDEIESRDGAVLLEAQGRKVLILKGQLDRNTQEGRFKIRYLSNGIFMRYGECDFLLKRDNQNSWFVQNAYTGQPVTMVKVITHSVGVETLQGLCPAF